VTHNSPRPYRPAAMQQNVVSGEAIAHY